MTITRTRRALLAATGAVFALSVTWPAAAADLVEPKTSNDGGKTVIGGLAPFSEEVYTPKGGKPGPYPEDENFVPSVGDRSDSTEKLLQDGATIATGRSLCTTTQVVQTTVTLDCASTLTFKSGTIRLAPGSTFDLTTETPDEIHTVDIIGGTGSYQGATGTIAYKEFDDKSDAFTLTFTTTGTQVSRTPSGGSNSGALHEVDSTDAGLIGLGAVALGGGMLLVARTRVARRVR